MGERVATGHVYRHEGARGDVWRAKLRLPDGKQVHRRIGPAWTERGRPAAGHYTKQTAEKWLRDALAAAGEGALPGQVRSGATIASVAAEYLAHLERDRNVKPSTLRDYRSIIAHHVEPAFGALAPEQLTARQVERWQRSIEASNRTRVKVLTLLHGVMAYAVKRHGVPSNPVAEVEKPKAGARAEIDVLSVEEVHALVRAAADEQDGAIYLTAALTGLRRGELIALRWRALDFDGSTIRVVASYAGETLTTPKSGKGRSVPLAPEVAQALAKLSQRGEHTEPDDLVFVGAAGSYLDGSALRRRYKAALVRAGLRDLRFHDLRHTFGTRLAASGVDLWRIQHWMGHADQRTTDLYAHYAPRASDAALVADAFARPAQAGAEAPQQAT